MRKTNFGRQRLCPFKVIDVLALSQIRDSKNVLSLCRVHKVKGIRFELFIPIDALKMLVLMLYPATSPKELLSHIVIMAEYHKDLGILARSISMLRDVLLNGFLCLFFTPV